ncbi:MAG TPA: DUF222 domain-containing protein [Acidimicrobiales bacterium]|nr:DUF222 domain-containing protein [Acidimicrobiales bacterium]
MSTSINFAAGVTIQQTNGASAFEPRTRPRARRDAVGDLPTERLEAELVDLADRLAAGTYELLVLVGEYDERGTWALRGALSCAAWLAELCDIEVCTARTQVRVAKALREFPELDAAMRNGDLSYAKARVLVPWLTHANATELIGIAETTPAGRLGMAIAAWAHRSDDQDLIEQHQRDTRSCTWRTEGDGMVTITARLTPAAAGAVCAVIDAQVTRTTPAVTVKASDTHDDASADASSSYPSLAQQRADALVTVVTQTGAGNVDSEVIVHVRQDGNTLVDGTPLSDHTVAKMLPDAFVTLLIHDADNEPIDATPRRRFPTPRQRKVIDARQDQCQQPGCHARNFLDYDHIHPYTRGGPTILENLQRLCGPHNRAKADGVVGTPAKWLSLSS